MLSFVFINSNIYIWKNIILRKTINEENKLIEIIDLKKRKTSLPISVLLMAGGRGERLKPLTDSIPKPMLLVGNKPILEHNIELLVCM